MLAKNILPLKDRLLKTQQGLAKKTKMQHNQAKLKLEM